MISFEKKDALSKNIDNVAKVFSKAAQKYATAPIKPEIIKHIINEFRLSSTFVNPNGPVGADKVIELIEDSQRDPSIFFGIIALAIEQKGASGADFFKATKDFFWKIGYLSLSSVYSLNPIDPNKRFDALLGMKEHLSQKGLQNEFNEFLNQLIHDDYIGGQDLTWQLEKQPVVNLPLEKQKKTICVKEKFVNCEKDEKDHKKDVKAIANILTGKSIENVNNININFTKNCKVLPFFQNKKNNKLFFNGNRKISSTNPRFNGKTPVKIYLEYFGDCLNTSSIRRLYGTIGFEKKQNRYASEKIIKDYEKKIQTQINLYKNNANFFGKNTPNVQITKEQIDSAIKDVNDIVSDAIAQENVPNKTAKLRFLEDPAATANNAGNPKVVIEANPPINVNPPAVLQPQTDNINININNNSIPLLNNSEGKELFKNFISCKNFTDIDPTEKIIFVNNNISCLTDYVVNTDFKEIEIQNSLFSLENILHFFDQKNMLRITDMKHFNKIKGFNQIGHDPNFIKNFFNIQKTFLNGFRRGGIYKEDYSYDGNSAIIENCKRLYYCRQAQLDNPLVAQLKNEMLDCITNFLLKNKEENNNFFAEEKVANALFGFKVTGNNETRSPKDKFIKINDLDFLNLLIQKINDTIDFNSGFDQSKTNKFKNYFIKIVDATEKQIYPKTLELLMNNNLISRQKLAQELVKIIHKSNNHENIGDNIESVIEKACKYLGIEDLYKGSSDNNDYNKMIVAMHLAKIYNIDVKNIVLKEVRDEDLLMNTVIAKELCDCIVRIDIPGVSQRTENQLLIKSAKEVYDDVDKFGFLPQKNNADINNSSKKTISNTEQLKDLVKKLRHCVLSQIEEIEKKVILLEAERQDGDLKKMKSVIINGLNGVKSHVLKPAIVDMNPKPINNCIKKEVAGLKQISTEVVIQYREFIKIYNNKYIDEHKKKQENLIKSTKSELVNNLKKDFEKIQKEWMDFFQNYKSNNKIVDDLENFFYKNYDNIDNHCNEIIKNIKAFKGNNADSLNKQAKKNIERLKKEIKKFDNELKNKCNIRKENEQELRLITKQEASPANSEILTTKESLEQIKNIKNEEKKTYDFSLVKRDDFYKKTKPIKQTIFFDKKQKSFATVGTFSTIGSIIVYATLASPLSLIGIAIGFICATGIAVRKKINDVSNTRLSANLGLKKYKETFDERNEERNEEQEEEKEEKEEGKEGKEGKEEGSKQQENEERQKENSDTETSIDNEQDEKISKLESKIKNKVNTNLKDNNEERNNNKKIIT